VRHKGQCFRFLRDNGRTCTCTRNMWDGRR
jgi:hypothetical protein